MRRPLIVPTIFSYFLLANPAIAGGQTIDAELAAAVEHLQTVDATDRSYIKFFTTYAVPEDLRKEAVLALSFWTHSLTGTTKDGSGNTGYFEPIAKIIKTGKPIDEGFPADVDQPLKLEDEFVPLKQVDGSSTLWWVDIRDYNWTEEAFEKVSIKEPYIRKPWVGDNYDKLRLASGNSLIRADWFLMHTADTTRQFDRGQPPLYYELLYANVGIPKTDVEYRKIWGIDVAKAEKFGLARGSIVDKGKSIVSRHTRELTGIRTDVGYHWESADVKTMDNDNDFLENLAIERDANGAPKHVGLARKADAHEYITTNLLGLQVYFLANGKGERVEFADPTIVIDTKSKTDDMRVRTARSCVMCHSQGINPTQDELRKIIGEGVDLIATYKDYQQAVKTYYLSNIADREVDDQLIFSRAVEQANGLSPEANTTVFGSVLDWYDRNVSLEQASLECGVDVKTFSERVGKSTSVRLARLVKSGTSIPREVWENPKGGAFAQAMLLINKMDALPANKIATPRLRVIKQDGAEIYAGKAVVTVVPFGRTLPNIGKSEDGNFYKVNNKAGKNIGFVRAEEVEEFNSDS